MGNELILGYRISAKPKSEIVDDIVAMIDDGRKSGYLVCANPHSLEIAAKDVLFQNSLINADIIVPDGIGIIIASFIFGNSIRQRVTGSDIFAGVNKILNERKTSSCFFLGSTSQALLKIRNKMAADFPNIKIAGTYSPPFKPEFSELDNLLMVDAINRVVPDVLWVGMTAPKQEKWIYSNRHRLNVKFIGAIGAVFDFYTGSVKRPHPFFQQIGLEWLPRLMKEPRRLWRRNLVSSPMFMLRVLRKRLYPLK